MIQRFALNREGRDFAVGDIHGYFTRLKDVLIAAGFNPAKDRLFSVGDLVDRGPECEQALDWLAQPWFHAVRGNHEDYAIRYMSTGLLDVDNYRLNGGGWFIELTEERQAIFAAAFKALPYAIEVETHNGLVGILHADCPVLDWNNLPEALKLTSGRMHTIWSRVRIENADESPVANIYAVLAGHTPLREVMALGNVIHIDTAGWMDEGHFTLLNLAGIRW